MQELLTLENLIALGLLTLLQAVLGFDNLLYISIESKRVPADKQAMVRRWGIDLAVGLRIILLFAVIKVIAYFQDPFLHFSLPRFIEGEFNIHSLIVLVGGLFILYTATKEIFHMLALDELELDDNRKRPVWVTITWIVLMNLVFSFDSILSAMALSDNFWVMATAIVIGGILMIWLSDHVAEFLEKNRMYEVLGLFVLFIVGIMLLSEGGHLGQLRIFDQAITPMSKATFYFVIFALLLVEIVQSRYQKKLIVRKQLYAAKERT